MAARKKSNVTHEVQDEVPSEELGGIRGVPQEAGRHHDLVRRGRRRGLECAAERMSRRPTTVLGRGDRHAAHQQARAENGMYRYKRIIGDRLRAKKFEAQKREAIIAVNAINRMTEIGMPKNEAIAA